jgi:hypothetical protein
MSNSESSYKIPLMIFALVVVIWGVLGVMDIGKATQIGYNTDGNNTITQVYDGGPAKAAGLMVGDYLVSIDGHSTEDAAAMLALPRAEIGKVWNLVVRRDGAEIPLNITAGPLLPRTKILGYAAAFLGLCFVGFTLMAYLGGASRATLVLAFMGSALGSAFMGGPYIESAGLRSVVNTISPILVFAGLGALLHFLLVFPNPREFINKSNAKLMLYAPAAVFVVLVAYRQLFTPAATSGLNTLTNVVAGLVVGFYLLGSIVTMWQNHSRASAEDRSAKGLNTMLLGTLVGLLPVAVGTVAGIFSPQTVLPGQDFYFLTLILIPITWSMAAKK